mmetsp:Transcript_7446/g.12409  ORF Transcript_7446/g.12409 Transcript_7446/m.12409 type:complete len:106 (-) Transcript_7446:118-435(-)
MISRFGTTTVRTGARNIRLARRFKSTSAATLTNHNFLKFEKVHPAKHNLTSKNNNKTNKNPLVLGKEQDVLPQHKHTVVKALNKEDAMEMSALYTEIEKLHPSHK